MKNKNKRAQEELVGFAMIIIVVSVILLVFIGFSINKAPNKEIVESYEADSFVQAMLQYTTDCSDNLEMLSIQKLIFKCEAKGKCADSRDTCEILDLELKGILNESWPISENTPVKGYALNITSGNERISYIKEGISTGNSKSSAQFFQDSSIIFTAYY